MDIDKHGKDVTLNVVGCSLAHLGATIKLLMENGNF